MKTNPIILQGPANSGKSFIANTILDVFPEHEVIRINATTTTFNSISREVSSSIFKAIFFEECRHIEQIKELFDLVKLNALYQNRYSAITILFALQSTEVICIPDFKVIKCTYKP